MNQFDLVWMRISRVISFCAGLGIMVYETVGDQQDRPWLYAAALGLMGVPIARAAESVLGKFTGTSAPQEDLPKKPEPPQVQSK